MAGRSVIVYIIISRPFNLIKIGYRKVTSGVSGKTSYLVVGGVLEDGRPIEDGSKYKTAKVFIHIPFFKK